MIKLQHLEQQKITPASLYCKTADVITLWKTSLGRIMDVSATHCIAIKNV